MLATPSALRASAWELGRLARGAEVAPKVDKRYKRLVSLCTRITTRVVLRAAGTDYY